MNCNSDISENELLAYLETKPSQIALFSIKVFSSTTAVLSCLFFDNGIYYQYAAQSQIRPNVAITSITIIQRELLEGENDYDLIWETFNKPDTQPLQQDTFFDIVTTENIYRARLICQNTNANYAKEKTMQEYLFYSEELNDWDYLLFLYIYIGINAVVLGNNIGYEFLREYILVDEGSNETFYMKLSDYYTVNLSVMNELLRYIASGFNTNINLVTQR
jgi:hypothetical protein